MCSSSHIRLSKTKLLSSYWHGICSNAKANPNLFHIKTIFLLEFCENLLLLSKWWQIHRKQQIQMVKIANNVIKTTQPQILLRAEIPKFSRSMMPKNRLKVKFVLNNTLFNWYNLEAWGHQGRLKQTQDSVTVSEPVFSPTYGFISFPNPFHKKCLKSRK